MRNEGEEEDKKERKLKVMDRKGGSREKTKESILLRKGRKRKPEGGK